jgi:hypothetical protein
MSPYRTNPALLSVRGDDNEFLIKRPSTREYVLLEELGFVRREAQAEANLAYEDWRCRPCGDSYAVYLAAQDRADAAQDDLADYARRVAGLASGRTELPDSSARRSEPTG